MSLTQQFGLLLWKNYLLRKRQTLVTVVELALPLLFSCVFIWLRLYAPLGENYEDNVFETFSVNTLPDLSSTQDGKLNGSFQLAYVPSGYTAVQQVAEYVQQSLEDNTRNDYQNLGGSRITSVRGFETEQQFEDYVRNDNESGKVLAAVVFEHPFSHVNEPLSRQVRYRLRFPYNPRSARERTHHPPVMVSPLRGVQSNWHTHHLFAVSQQPGPRTPVRGMDKGGVPGYYEQGFLALQHAVDQAIMRSYNRTSADSLLNRTRVRLSRFPEPAYRLDYFIVAIQPILPLLLMLSYTYTSLNIVRAVVQEKETKLKEYMRMMGLNNWLHWSAWFLMFFLLLFVSIFFVTLLLCLPVSPRGAVLSHSDPTLVFVFLLVFTVATINFNFMISTFFSRADVAAAAGGFIYFLSFMPYMFLMPRYELLSHAQKTSACLISNIAMGMGAQLLGSFEGKGTGIQWSNLFDPVTVDDDLSLALVLGLLLLDALLYGLVAWYMESVFPGEYGVPLPYYFFILPSYWRSTPHTAPVNGNGEGEDVGNAVKGEFMEEEPTGMVSGIKIKHLTKEFKVGRKTRRAVRDLTVNMFEGQITVLLGHNGAGKTTALSMLTGLFPPTSGRAYINGYDICRDMDLIRHSLGYCPQHNVLFDNLTVREHLLFYALLKGFPRDQVLAEVDQIIRNLNLEDKRHDLSKTLSGGMKRKLSIGIALTGNSKVVMLDEPTSGIDPSARRAIWDLLQGEKRGRTIVLSTHFMDEADLLGDRIAIMTGGELQCCGSPLFLKNRYGAGYHMVIVKDVNCNVFEITCLVHKYVPNAKLESNVGAELSYILPKENTDSFELLFSELEVNRQKLGITSYGASLTTMEEVFLRVGKLVDSSLDIQAIQLPAMQHDSHQQSTDDALQHDSHQQSTDDAGSTVGMADHTDITDSRMLSSEDFTNLKLNTGLRLYLQQFYAMFLKRALYSLRNWKVMVAQFLVPLVFMIATLFALRASPSFPNSPLWLDLRHYSPTTVPMVLEPRDGTLADLARECECHVKASQAQIIKTTNLNDYILARVKEEGRAFSQQCVVGTAFRGKNSSGGFAEDTVIAYFNDQGYHTSATALMMVDNALFKHLAGSDASIQTGNHPMPPRTHSEGSQTKIFADGFQIAMSLMFGMASLSSTFALLLVKERSVKSRHVQQVSGLHLPNFWFSALLWDLLNFLLPCLLLLGVFRAFAVKAFVEDNRLANVLLILLLYGWAVIPLMYLLSFLFDKAGTAYVRLFIFNILSGFITTMIVAVMKEIAVNECSGDRAECDSRTAVLLDKMFMIFPNYCLGMSFTQFYHNYLLTSFCTTKGESQAFCEYYKLTFEENYFSMSEPGVGRFLVPFLVQGIVFITLLFVIELQIVWTLQRFLGSLRGILGRRLTQRPVTADAALLPEDSDVAEERKRVLECQPAVESMAGNPLILRELSKVYGSVGTLQAVDRLSLAVGKGECFGLLGFNGAGKTTTFKMLTGDESVTSGNAYIDGYSILSDIKKVQRRIGYCPQFDALLDHMTGRETLHMYARLRGIPEKYLSVCAEKVLGSLLLEPHADKLVSAYSGGNKRKLSTGVALIGGPPVLFLDEPSTGMDPVARRLLWDAVTRTRESGKAVVITTHSMEECEALCTRLAVMVNGRLQCLGSPQHLKSKFGSGYTLLAKVARDLEEVDPEESESKLHRFKRFIEGTFPGSLLKDEHQRMVHYHLTDKTATWAGVFGTMEAAKEKYGIGDYCVSQISLEQVFLSFAQFQHSTV